MNQEKPFWQKTKVWYTVIILALVAGTLIPLALLGKVEVTSEQIFSFAEWVFGVVIGAHGLQRGLGYIGQGIGSRAAEAPMEALAPVVVEAETKEEDNVE